MAEIQLRNLHHSYGEKGRENEFSISGLDLSWEHGTANALLGPSGCGKTTLLNVISGLLRPKGGSVLVDGKDVTALAPRDRHIAQVFQFPVVYESMTVYDNLAFPLRNSRKAEPDIKKRVETIAELLGLEKLLHIKSRRLTAAEKQKLSLGRGIVREDTSAVLLDEPLAVIDPKEKLDLRRRLREIQRSLNVTMIYVTHDQHEALTFADHVTLMKDGRIVQTGTPRELYDDPATPFVGYFIGSPGMNILDARLTNDGLRVGNAPIECSERFLRKLQTKGSSFKLGIRPEFVEVSEGDSRGGIRCDVRGTEDTGAYKVLSLSAGLLDLKARVREDSDFSGGKPLWVKFPESRITIFRPEEESST